MNGELVGGVALVTGAARGIGRACAEALAAAGATVHSADTTEHDGAPGIVPVVLDVTDSAAVDRVLEGLDPPAQILVSNAGVYAGRDGLAISDDDWRRTFAVIADGTFHGTRAAVGILLRRGLPGAVVNIASIAGKRGFAGQADYCAAKAAVIGFTRAAALDVAAHDITVNAICPGTIATPMIEQVIRDVARSGGSTEDEVRRAIIGQVPIGRMQAPEEIAAAVVFLASTAARSITGESWVIDGGQTRD